MPSSVTERDVVTMSSSFTPTGMTFFKVVTKVDQPGIETDGFLHVKRAGPDAGYIGLRETVEDALERTELFHDKVSKASHCVLQVTFSALGLAFYTKENSGPDHYFKPMLNKKIFNASADWGVWHFMGDMPLNAVDNAGNPLITCSWFGIE